MLIIVGLWVRLTLHETPAFPQGGPDGASRPARPSRVRGGARIWCGAYAPFPVPGKETCTHIFERVNGLYCRGAVRTTDSPVLGEDARAFTTLFKKSRTGRVRSASVPSFPVSDPPLPESGAMSIEPKQHHPLPEQTRV